MKVIEDELLNQTHNVIFTCMSKTFATFNLSIRVGQMYVIYHEIKKNN